MISPVKGLESWLAAHPTPVLPAELWAMTKMLPVLDVYVWHIYEDAINQGSAPDLRLEGLAQFLDNVTMLTDFDSTHVPCLSVVFDNICWTPYRWNGCIKSGTSRHPAHCSRNLLTKLTLIAVDNGRKRSAAALINWTAVAEKGGAATSAWK